MTENAAGESWSPLGKGLRCSTMAVADALTARAKWRAEDLPYRFGSCAGRDLEKGVVVGWLGVLLGATLEKREGLQGCGGVVEM